MGCSSTMEEWSLICLELMESLSSSDAVNEEYDVKSRFMKDAGKLCRLDFGDSMMRVLLSSARMPLLATLKSSALTRRMGNGRSPPWPGGRMDIILPSMLTTRAEVLGVKVDPEELLSLDPEEDRRCTSDSGLPGVLVGEGDFFFDPNTATLLVVVGAALPEEALLF